MSTTVFHFDVFTSTRGKGNPAGIVLAADHLKDDAMQAVAATTGFGDTAFISSSNVADFRIRYFSPKREVELCGHATIAASIALHSHGSLTDKALPLNFFLQTKVGTLPIAIDASSGDTLVHMSQPTAQFRPFNGDLTLLMKSLGIMASDINPNYPITYGSTGRWTLIVPIRDLSAMRKLQPTPKLFEAVLADLPGASIHPFCFEVIDADAAMHARHFSSPSSGALEDPVTGTASGVLGAYHDEFVNRARDSSQPLVIEQGYEVGREGRVLVWVKRNGDRHDVRIAGTACFVERLIM